MTSRPVAEETWICTIVPTSRPVARKRLITIS
jgi:hypothetical protein